MPQFTIHPINGETLTFEGEVIGDVASEDGVTVTIYQTTTGRYVAEVTELVEEYEQPARIEVRAWVCPTGRKLAKVLLHTRGGLRRDDPSRWVIRAALDAAGLDSVRRI